MSAVAVLPTQKLYTPAEVCALTRMARRSIDRLIEEGRLEAVYPLGKGRGKPVRLSIASVERLIGASLSEPVPVAQPNVVPPVEEETKPFAALREAVARVVDQAPPLTLEQRTELAVLLGGAR